MGRSATRFYASSLRSSFQFLAFPLTSLIPSIPRYFFLFVTLIAMAFPQLNRGGACSSSTAFVSFSLVFEGFFTKLSTLPRKQWSYQQKWVTVLLIGLFFFNDPLFRYTIYAEHSRTAEALAAIYIIWSGGFVCLLMLFWLCALDETASAAGEGKGCCTNLCGGHRFKR